MAHTAAAAVLAALGVPPQRPPHLTDLVHTLFLAAAFLMLRLISERAILPGVKAVLTAWRRRRAPKSCPGSGPGSDSEEMGDSWRAGCADVFDNAYISFMSASLLAVGLHTVLVSGNDGCVPWDTTTCLQDLPSTPHPEQRLYWVLCFHFLLNELGTTWLGLGTVLNRVMVYHHLLTLSLLAAVYSFNLLRFGTMVMALFDLSNPLLHFAKALYSVDALLHTNIKWPAFTAFALTFFICRVLCPPFAVLKPSLAGLWTVSIPWPFAYFCIAAIVAIYILQIHWFIKIVQMSRRSDESKEQQHNDDDKSQRASSV